MADDKNKGKEGDLKDSTVHVTVKPKEGKTLSETRNNKDAAEKIKDGIKEGVKQDIEKRKGQGATKQLDVVDEAADKAKKGVSPRVVEDVEIKVDGKTTDGDEVTRRRKVKPTEK
jgi:hypothetical protein